ncbi:MAG: transporter [Bacteroidetes bacterium]|nr:polyphosphate polymerase domain-containing protein [Bacteroidia bacterium]PCH66192.1 MAG: transporter [Bacteroidota bacterium]
MQSLGTDSFTPITLEEMDGVKLMNRRDTKFVFNVQSLDSLLNQLKEKYKILEVEDKRSSQYETLYFDTDDFKFYTNHHNGKLNRYKVRFRKYVESDKLFLEVKFKSNKERTVKKRIIRTNIKADFQGRSKELIENGTNIDASQLQPKLWVHYKRITLVSNDLKERVTIDYDLGFKTFDERGKEITNLIIAEVKQGKLSMNSFFMQLMRKEKIQQMRISKYCTGIALLYDFVKTNRFKEKILTINKVAYGNVA